MVEVRPGRGEEGVTCYDCGARVSKAVRQYREAKDKRYKSGFRDVCEPCYDKTKRPRKEVQPMTERAVATKQGETR